MTLLVQALTAGYPGRPVLKGVTLPLLLPASVTALLGPNGSGKSTLLKALAGLLPCGGVMKLEDTALDRLPLAERVERVAYLPQSLPRGVHLRVVETLLAALRAGGRPQADAMLQAQQVLERLGIQTLAMQYLDALSGGQRQLVGLAQALVRQPRVLLLDEPLAALDLRHQLRTMRLIGELAAERGMAVLIVLHDLNIALRDCTAAVLLKDGEVKAAGAPAEAITDATLAQVYGVRARVQACSLGQLQVLVDGELDQAGV